MLDIFFSLSAILSNSLLQQLHVSLCVSAPPKIKILSNRTRGSSSFTARGKSKPIKSEEVEKWNFICILKKPFSLGERHNIWMTSCISRAPYLRGRESDLHRPSGNPPRRSVAVIFSGVSREERFIVCFHVGFSR